MYANVSDDDDMHIMHIYFVTRTHIVDKIRNGIIDGDSAIAKWSKNRIVRGLCDGNITIQIRFDNNHSM